jgi:hypothetical protein
MELAVHSHEGTEQKSMSPLRFDPETLRSLYELAGIT